MTKILEDQVALITGATRGIGREIALLFAQEGARLSICGRSEEALRNVGADIRGNGLQCLELRVDVMNEPEVIGVVKKTLDTYGRIDILVNNAGVTKDNLVARLSEDEWQQVLAVNLRGTFLFTKAISKCMVAQQRGKIINISSVVGFTGNTGQANYAASKAGIIGFTKSAARELSRENICVNAVAPGFIDTEMTANLSEGLKSAVLREIPLGRFGSSKDVARAVVFLASKHSDYITGQILVVDGGMVI